MALTGSRDTKQRGAGPVPHFHTFPVAASVKCIQGGLAVLSAGYVKPGVIATGLVSVGCFAETVDNSSGSAGDKSVRVDSGTFRWANSADADLIAQANVGAVCYVVDDLTVALTSNSTTRSVAGVIDGVDSDGVWVTSLLPAAVLTATASTQVTCIVSIPIPALSGIADAQVVARFTPGFAGRITKTSFQAVTAVSTGAKASTLTPKIATTNVTGGVLSLTSAGLDTVGKVVAGSAVSAANTFTNAQEITVVASATTAFIEGAGVLLIHIA
jgi:hypothetical protein